MRKCLHNEDPLVVEYREAGMSLRHARLQAKLYRRAAAPQDHIISLRVDAETFEDLKADAEKQNRTVGEIVRGRLRIAEGAMDDEHAGRERAMRRALKKQPHLADVETR
jgi:hypothetical protein